MFNPIKLSHSLRLADTHTDAAEIGGWVSMIQRNIANQHPNEKEIIITARDLGYQALFVLHSHSQCSSSWVRYALLFKVAHDDWKAGQQFHQLIANIQTLNEELLSMNGRKEKL